MLIVFSLSFSVFATTETRAATESDLALEGPTWDHSTVNILVTTPSNESWWDPSYLTATLHAIAQWNDAIAYFASNHSSFAYLSKLKMEPQFSDSINTDIDAHVSWTRQFGNATCEAGLTKTTYTSLGTITNVSLAISAYDCRGNILSEADSQNVALHELGHLLGLAHSNYSGDLMYFSYTLSSPVRAISTLDLYGVSTVFRWMAFSLEFDKANFGPQISSVTLPQDITYEYVPISEQNLPPRSPFERVRTYIGSFTELVAEPEFWALMVLSTIAVVSILLLGRRARRRRTVSEKTGAHLKKA